MKYTHLSKEEYDIYMQDFEFKTIFNKIVKLKNRLEKRKNKLLSLAKK